MKGAWLMLMAGWLPQGPGGEPSFAAALADLRAGRHEAAYQGFAALYAAAGETAAPALRSNYALAALHQKRPQDAEQVMRPLLEHPAAHERQEAEFVLGMAALLRGEMAAAAAALPDAEPMAWQAAVDAASRAVGHFGRAAERDGGWPEALRNAERAWRRGEAWRQARDQNRPEAKKEDAPPPPPAPTDDRPLEEQLPELSIAPLSPRELAELAQKLARKEREKRAVRSLRQQDRSAGERGW